MKPKTKPISDLYHRFISDSEYRNKIEPQVLAVRLHIEGKIDLIPHLNRATIEHYRLTEDFNQLNREDQYISVLRIMDSMTGVE